jgi:uncharacterized membrane protein
MTNNKTPEFIQSIACLAAFTYAAGWYVGTLIHRLNDRLAGKQPPTPPRVATVQPLRAEITVRASMAPERKLHQLTVRELRCIARAAGIRSAGGRRVAQATKAALLAEIQAK